MLHILSRASGNLASTFGLVWPNEFSTKEVKSYVESFVGFKPQLPDYCPASRRGVQYDRRLHRKRGYQREFSRRSADPATQWRCQRSRYGRSKRHLSRGSGFTTTVPGYPLRSYGSGRRVVSPTLQKVGRDRHYTNNGQLMKQYSKSAPDSVRARLLFC